MATVLTLLNKDGSRTVMKGILAAKLASTVVHLPKQP